METRSYSKVDTEHLHFICINAETVLKRNLNNQGVQTSR